MTQRICILLLLMLVPLSAAPPFLETTIQLPDTDYTAVALCAAPDADKVYCATVGPGPDYAGQLVVLDVSTNTVLRTIPVLREPQALAYNPTENRLYCMGEADSAIFVLDVSTDSVVDTLRFGGGAGDLLWNPANNRLYSAAYGVWPAQDSVLGVLDCAGGGLLHALVVGNRPKALCRNESGSRVYCGNFGDGRLVVVESGGDTLLRRIETGGRLVDAVYCTSSEGAYFLDTWLDRIVVVDGSGDSMRAVLPTGPGPRQLACNERTGRMYCVNGSGGFTVVDCHADTIMTPLLPTESGRAVAVDAARNRVYCTTIGPVYDYLSVYDGTTHGYVKSFRAGPDPDLMLWIPRYARMYVVNVGSDTVIVVRDTTPAGVTEETAVPVERPVAMIVRGVLHVPGHEPAVLLDISGREVLDLVPGENDVRHLSPGVYFVRPASTVPASGIPGDSPFRAKVILTR